MSKATLSIHNRELDLPVLVGTEREVGIDIGKLRKSSNAITLDPGYGNTGSCTSAITYIDGERGVLRYRGYAIEDLAESASFVEVMHLLVFGALPTMSELQRFRLQLSQHTLLHEDMKKFLRRVSTEGTTDECAVGHGGIAVLVLRYQTMTSTSCGCLLS